SFPRNTATWRPRNYLRTWPNPGTTRSSWNSKAPLNSGSALSRAVSISHIVSDGRRIDDPRILHDGPGPQRMGLCPRGVKDVLHGNAAHHEGVRDQAPVAAPRYCLCAQEGRTFTLCPI